MAKTKTPRKKAKTRKAITKRFKFTRTGKIMRRATGQDHFLAKKPKAKKRGMKKWIELSAPETRKLRALVKQ